MHSADIKKHNLQRKWNLTILRIIFQDRGSKGLPLLASSWVLLLFLNHIAWKVFHRDKKKICKLIWKKKICTDLIGKLEQNELHSLGYNEWPRNPIGFAHTNLAVVSDFLSNSCSQFSSRSTSVLPEANRAVSFWNLVSCLGEKKKNQSSASLFPFERTKTLQWKFPANSMRTCWRQHLPRKSLKGRVTFISPSTTLFSTMGVWAWCTFLSATRLPSWHSKSK